MDFFRSRAGLVFLGVNLAFPVAAAVFLGLVELNVQTGAILVYTVAAILFAGNVFGAVKFSNYRAVFGVFLFLNLVSLFALGDISFVTVLPDLPDLYYNLSQYHSQQGS
ncbi:MAG TPA: hypothetical protein VD713_06130 [Sphingomonadales bacterium]|nr:hypothetical protein [Sphingomonadales bacterium]